MLKLRRILALVIVVAIVLLGLVIWRYVRQMPVQEVLDSLPRGIDLALDNLTYTETRDGLKRWTLVADRAEYLRGDNLVRLTPVHLTFYAVDEVGDMVLTADHGEFHEDKRQIDVWDNVVIVGSRGERLETEALRYQDQQRLLTTAAAFHYQGAAMSLTGVGLRIDMETNLLVVENDVRLLLPAQPKENMGEN